MMADQADKYVDMHIENGALEQGIASPSASASGKEDIPLKLSNNGIALVPQPSDDPRDPLVCLFSFSPCGGKIV